MSESFLPASAARVQAALDAAGVQTLVVEMPETTRTAADAAKAVGCEVGQIAKSLIFRGVSSGDAILVITSGANRVDESVMAQAVGERIEKASADFARERSGFAIGGVPPVGHATPMRTFIDQDLLRYDRIWAAAGTPHAVFQFSAFELPRMTRGSVIAVTQKK
ncbi:MAG: YbaK/EbsC family protein [Thermoanaerobaculia bacterium]